MANENKPVNSKRKTRLDAIEEKQKAENEADME